MPSHLRKRKHLLTTKIRQTIFRGDCSAPSAQSTHWTHARKIKTKGKGSCYAGIQRGAARCFGVYYCH